MNTTLGYLVFYILRLWYAKIYCFQCIPQQEETFFMMLSTPTLSICTLNTKEVNTYMSHVAIILNRITNIEILKTIL